MLGRTTSGKPDHSEDAMEISNVAEYARALFEAHGDKAEAEAAQKAKKHEDAGEAQEAANWREIRAAIREIRGAHES
jgi:hypothetical protein